MEIFRNILKLQPLKLPINFILIIFLLLVLNKCDHEKSVELYAISKYKPDKFVATACPTYSEYITNQCKNNLKTGIGYSASDV